MKPYEALKECAGIVHFCAFLIENEMGVVILKKLFNLFLCIVFLSLSGCNGRQSNEMPQVSEVLLELYPVRVLDVDVIIDEYGYVEYGTEAYEILANLVLADFTLGNARYFAEAYDLFYESEFRRGLRDSVLQINEAAPIGVDTIFDYSIHYIRRISPNLFYVNHARTDYWFEHDMEIVIFSANRFVLLTEENQLFLVSYPLGDLPEVYTKGLESLIEEIDSAADYIVIEL